MASAVPAFTPIAETGGEWADFGPYVAAINDSGMVAFRARRSAGGSSVFLGTGGLLQHLEIPAGELIGHPDLDNSGCVSFLLEDPATGPALWLRATGGALTRAESAAPVVAMGPRGPVMNDSGSAVFCVRYRHGSEAVGCAVAGRLHPVLTTGEIFRAFPGLPDINRGGTIVFAAELHSGASMILLRRGDTLTTVADTFDEFQDLGGFPSLNDAGEVAFTGTLRSGTSGAFLWTNGNWRPIADPSGSFESVRSVILHGASGLVLCATPRGRQLGIYRGAGPNAPRLIGLGDAFQDSTVADFALNAVSVNSTGQIALRIRLANGRQLILRSAPATDPKRE